MIELLLSGLACLVIIGRLCEKTWLNIASLFCFIWGVISWAASLRLYGMRDYSDSMYLIVFLGCLGFVIGYVMKRCLSKQNYHVFVPSSQYTINKKWFNIFFYIISIFMTYFVIKVIFLLKTGVPYYMIRTLWGRMSVEESLLSNKYESYIQVFVVQALIPLFFLFLVFHLLHIYTLTKTQLLKIILIIIAYIFVSGSRITITNAIFQSIFLFSLLKIKMKKQSLRKIGIFLALLLFSISIISDERTNTDATKVIPIEETYYEYAALAIPMGDYYINMCDRRQEKTNGSMFFYGFSSILYRTLSLLNIPPSDNYQLCLKYHVLIDEFITIYDGHTNNAYASVFFYYYLDFGILGVFFFSLIFGFLVKTLLVRCQNKRDLRSIMIFATLLIAVIKSFARWEFVNTFYCLSFIYIYILTKRTDVTERR